MYKRYFKRIIEFCLAFVALLLLFPLLLIITVWLYFMNKGAGVFFFQKRPGREEKIFEVIKFKTMTDEKDSSGNLLPDAERLTFVGKFIRSTSIDELPQLINVLKGDMALIGPRPLLPHYLSWYTEEEKLRHCVRPGITGYAQSHGRNNITWDEKLAMDVWYVKNISLKTDIEIFLKTIKTVVLRESVEVAGVEDLDVYRKNKKDKV